METGNNAGGGCEAVAAIWADADAAHSDCCWECLLCSHRVQHWPQTHTYTHRAETLTQLNMIPLHCHLISRGRCGCDIAYIAVCPLQLARRAAATLYPTPSLNSALIFMLEETTPIIDVICGICPNCKTQ